jgi:uncharacterized membrane protein
MARKKRASAAEGKIASLPRKTKIALVNLVVFAALALVSYVLYRGGFTDPTLMDFFWMASLVLGFIAVAFLIAYLLLKLMPGIRSRR